MDWDSWPVLALLAEGGVRLLFIGIVLLRRRPAAVTLAWIVIILAVPVLGVLLYLLVGEIRLGRRRIRELQEIGQRIESSMPFALAAREALRPQLPGAYEHLAVLAESVSNVDALGGNRLQLTGDTDRFIQNLVDDIDRAEFHCNLLYYIYLDDYSGRTVAEALMRAAKRGVQCRLLVDAMGSKLFLKSELRGALKDAGVKVAASLEASFFRMLFHRIDLRNHRKIAVIDGVVGYTGSHNIADAAFAIKPKYAPWVDAVVRVEGPVVWDLQMLFVEDWFLDTGENLEGLLNIQPLAIKENDGGGGGVMAQVIGTGPGSYNAALRQLCQSAFHAAREELIITSPYFVPDEATLIALCTAARRGVDTMLVVPARNDSKLVGGASRSHYLELLECGVKIYEYTKGLLHSKTISIDRQIALVSTANLDRRSFELNFEVSLLVYDDDFAGELRFLQRGYIEDSRLLTLPEWKATPWPARLAYNAAGLLSPLI